MDYKKTSRIKKISIFIDGLGGGGAERVCVNIANGLASFGWHVNLIVFDSRGAKYHQFVNQSVNLVFLNIRARYSLFKIWSYLFRNPVDMVLSFNHQITVLLVLVRIISRLKYKIISRTINNLKVDIRNSNYFWQKYIIFHLVRLFYKRADYVINQCKAMERGLLDWIPELKGKTTYIYNPVNQLIFESKDTLDFCEDFILCVGRLEKQKSFDRAIKAFSALSSKYPDLKLYIVGDGALKNDLKSLVVKLNVDEKVRFISFTDSISCYYRKAKLTLLTSIYEGFPNVLIESISFGTPVVAYDCVSGPSEIIINGVNGYLVENGNFQSLVENISNCLESNFDSNSIVETSLIYRNEIILKKYNEVLSRFLK